MRETLAKYLNSFMKSKGISLLVSLVLKALGVAGGFWGWIATKAAKLAWKKADKEIQSAARLGDRDESDEKINETYQNKIKENASEESLIDTELDALNGGRSRKL